MFVPLLFTGVKCTQICKRDLAIYSQCSKVSWSLDLLLSLCSTKWEQNLRKTSLGSTGSEFFTVHKAKIQIWSTAVWTGILSLFVLNYSDPLSLTNTWNSEIPAQLMTEMWNCLAGSDQFRILWDLQVEGLFFPFLSPHLHCSHTSFHLCAGLNLCPPAKLLTQWSCCRRWYSSLLLRTGIFERLITVKIKRETVWHKLFSQFN